MNGRASVSALRRPWHAVVAIAGAAAVAVVLAFILVVVPLPNAASQIPDGLPHACADYIQRSASDISSSLCNGLTCNTARPVVAAAGTNCRQARQVATGLDVRLVGHAAGRGARFTQVQLAAGGTWRLAAAGPGTGDREAQLKERGASGRCQICRAGAQVGVSQSRAPTEGHAMNPGPQPEAMLVAARDVWGPQWPPCLSLTDIGPLPEPGIER